MTYIVYTIERPMTGTTITKLGIYDSENNPQIFDKMTEYSNLMNNPQWIVSAESVPREDFENILLNMQPLGECNGK